MGDNGQRQYWLHSGELSIRAEREPPGAAVSGGARRQGMRLRTGRALRVGNDSDYGASGSNRGFGAPDKPTTRAERPK